MTYICMIAAVSNNGVIGYTNGALPWSIKEDMLRFRRLTTEHTVIMGRKTYESIGRPLPNRMNIVITRHPPEKNEYDNLKYVSSRDEALDLVKDEKKVYIIGGGEIYQQFMDKADSIYLTRVDVKIEDPEAVCFPSMAASRWKLFISRRHEVRGTIPLSPTHGQRNPSGDFDDLPIQYEIWHSTEHYGKFEHRPAQYLRIHNEDELKNAQQLIVQNMIWYLGLSQEVNELDRVKINKDMLW